MKFGISELTQLLIVAINVSFRHVQALVAMNKDHAPKVQNMLSYGMRTLIGDARLAGSHVRSAASFSHRNGVVKANHIAAKNASIRLVQVVQHRGLVATESFYTII